MRILFVAPWIPSAERPRSLILLRMLAEEHEVRFLGLVKNDAERALAAQLPVADPVLVANPASGSMVRSLGALVAGESLQTGYANPSALIPALQREIESWKPDVVHLNVFRSAHLVEAAAPIPVIIDLDEFRSEYYHQLARSGANPAWRVLGRIEGPRMAAREQQMVRAGVRIILSGPEVPGPPTPGTAVVRSPCDFPLRRPGRVTAPVVLFVGRLSYEANVVGLRWFVDNCWAALKAAVPGVTLRVVGADPPPVVRAMAGDGIELHANVPEVTPYYAEATVAIAPIFRGTGIQLKLIQSLAAGVPTVTSSTVAERAGVRDHVHVRVADEPQQWVAALRDLLTDPRSAEAMSAAGREWAVAEHGTEAVKRQLAAAYEGMGL
ncbi:glycosyltransferase family 4 protein [Catenuloplanes japonicus]|uniref:glycosyltransferase family 4 protein n=1 Tax=Catenuloplanes japonicus TaxID=33876 RepID=UPI000526FF9C|nr:glycosyltransferase family 4 protein [Catenuloplanes japonicus]